jgi:penicillin-insensitive murein endopeptidase
MADIPVQDSRKFFMLPQGNEGGGYYTYGTPDQGRSQYSHPRLISLIGMVAGAWSSCDERKFGVGNISLAGGARHPDHVKHRSGLDVDIRPLRKDGKHLSCNIRDTQYDGIATAKLIELSLRNAHVGNVIFNDTSNRQVSRGQCHDDHFHVEVSLKG